MVIDLTPVWNEVNLLLEAVGTGLATWIVAEVASFLKSRAKFLDADTQTKLASVLEQALQNGISYALKTVEDQEAKVGPVTVSNPIVGIAARYVVNHVPQTLDKLGKSPDDVAQLILARLPNQPPTDTDTTGATVKVTQVDVKPL